MNSYLLTKLFYQELESSEAMQLHCTPHHQALFFRIIQIQNQVGWQTKSIGLPTENTMFFTCIGSYKTYKKCLQDLVSWGLIEELKVSKNQHQARHISLHTKMWTIFFAEASPEHLPKQVQDTAKTVTNASSSHCQSTGQCTTIASPAYKTNKLLNVETDKPLNFKTIKHTYLAEPSKSLEEEISDTSEKKVSAKEDAVDPTVEEPYTSQEKKKVAPKRKESSARVKEGAAPVSVSAEKANRMAKPDLLFKESPYVDKIQFITAFAGSEYEGANLEYYYEIVKNWSESKQARKKDWIATVKNWMLKDFKEGKLVTNSSTCYGKSKPTDTAKQNSYTVLGAAVDAYFERKYGK